jgi:hypothetical protein
VAGAKPVNDTSELIEKYRRLLIAHWEVPHEPALANRLYLENREIYRKLRHSESGRLAISELMRDPLVAVRLTAATQSLSWNSEEAERTLEAIEKADDAGPAAFSAKYVLLGWRDGSFNPDW